MSPAPHEVPVWGQWLLPPSSRHPLTCSVPITVPFLDISQTGTDALCGFCSDIWLLSLSMVLLRFIQTVAEMRISSFLLLSNVPCCECAPFCLCTFRNGFQVGAVMNKAAGSVHVPAFAWVWAFISFGWIPGSGRAGSFAQPKFNFLRNCRII